MVVGSRRDLRVPFWTILQQGFFWGVLVIKTSSLPCLETEFSLLSLWRTDPASACQRAGPLVWKIQIYHFHFAHRKMIIARRQIVLLKAQLVLYRRKSEIGNPEIGNAITPGGRAEGRRGRSLRSCGAPACGESFYGFLTIFLALGKPPGLQNCKINSLQMTLIHIRLEKTKLSCYSNLYKNSNIFRDFWG